MKHTIFIEAHKLGVLEPQFLVVLNEGPQYTKRERRGSFIRFARLVKDLGLLNLQAKVWGVSYGLNTLGELGLFVHFELPVREEMQLSEEKTRSGREVCGHCMIRCMREPNHPGEHTGVVPFNNTDDDVPF